MAEKDNKKETVKKVNPNDRVKGLGNVTAYLAELQKSTELDNEKRQETTKTISTMRNAINSISGAAVASAKASKDAVVSTASFTKESMSDLTSKLGEDINVKKENLLGMSIAAATPIFGHFAAKFMETDVFRNMAARIKDTLGNAISSIGSKLNSMLKGGWNWIKNSRIGKSASALGTSWKNRTGQVKRNDDGQFRKVMGAKEVAWMARQKDKLFDKKDEEYISSRVPKLAKGGYVKKDTLAKIHEGEVVAPIKTITESFFKALQDVQDDKDKKSKAPIKEQILEVAKEMNIKLGSLANKSDFELALNKAMVENPKLDALVKSFKVVSSIYTAPKRLLRFIFRPRGGYLVHLPKGGTPFEQQTTILGLIYATGMAKLDNIILHTKDTKSVLNAILQALGGTPLKLQDAAEIPGRYTIFEKLKEAAGIEGIMDKLSVFSDPSETGFVESIKKLTGHSKELAKISIGAQTARGKGGELTPEVLMHKFFSKVDKINTKIEEIKEGGGSGLFSKLKDKIPKLAKGGITKKDTMAQLHKGEAVIPLDKLLDPLRKLVRINKSQLNESKTQTTNQRKQKRGFDRLNFNVGKMGKGLKGIGSGMWKVGMMLFGVLGAVKTGLLTVLTTIGPILAALKPVFGIVMRLGSAFLGIAAGGAMGLWDAGKAVFGGKMKEWGTGFMSTMIGGFLGGTEAGPKGAKRGMMKGGAIGAGIGTLMGGPIGTLIGGAIGAIAGGLLGAIGGKNISKAMSFVGKGLGALVKGITKTVLFPITALWWVIKKIGAGIKGIYNIAEPLVSGVISFVGDVIMYGFEKLSELWTLVKSGWIKITGIAVRAFNDLILLGYDGINFIIGFTKDIINKVINFYKSIFTFMWNGIYSFVGKILSVLGVNIDDLASKVKLIADSVGGLVGGIIDFIVSPITKIKEIFNTAKEWLMKNLEKIPGIGLITDFFKDDGILSPEDKKANKLGYSNAADLKSDLTRQKGNIDRWTQEYKKVKESGKPGSGFAAAAIKRKIESQTGEYNFLAAESGVKKTIGTAELANMQTKTKKAESDSMGKTISETVASKFKIATDKLGETMEQTTAIVSNSMTSVSNNVSNAMSTNNNTQSNAGSSDTDTSELLSGEVR